MSEFFFERDSLSGGCEVFEGLSLNLISFFTS